MLSPPSTAARAATAARRRAHPPHPPRRLIVRIEFHRHAGFRRQGSATAVGTGTAPLTAGTSLLTLGILPKGTITVSDGSNTTTYKATGGDTVGDLLNAINKNAYGNAQVAAWLDPKGKLVISGKNQTATIQVGGTYAANVGFKPGNTFFQPTAPSSSASATSGTSATSGSSNAGSSSSSASPSASSSSSTSVSSKGTQSASTANRLKNSAAALQTTGTAEILLASRGLSGNIINLLA